MRACDHRVVDGMRVLYLSLMLLGFGSTVLAEDEIGEREFDFSIPQQEVNTALIEFAEQADLTLVFPDELVQGKSANEVIGTFTRQESIDILLAGTGLIPKFSNNIVLSISPTEQSVSEGETMNVKKKVGLFAAIMGVFIGGAGAQGQAIPNEDTQDEQIEEIIVTGSQIRGARTTGALPVSIISSEEIHALGAASGEDLFRALPQAGDVTFNTQLRGGGGQGLARGDVSSINLRGIGAGYTLMLINGRRMVPHPTSQGRQEFSYNANTIPIFALERLEVLRDGAAALYGADAIAGVINNVLSSDFEGLKVQAQHSLAPGTNLSNTQLNALWGVPISDGRGNITTFLGVGSNTGLRDADQYFTASSDLRPLLVGTSFEGNSAFRNTSASSAWGSFRALGGPGTVTSNGTPITSADGQFHIQPDTNAGCTFLLADGICIDDGSVRTGADDNLRFDSARGTPGKTTTPSIKRLNLFSSISYSISDDIEFFGELGYYKAEAESVTSATGPLGHTPVTVPASNYYNPFGPITSPNRLPGLNIPDEGLPVQTTSYALVDNGPRFAEIESDQKRILGGLRGEAFNWNWESALLYSSATASDVANNVQASLWQAAMARSTPDAYNPFNGGNINDPSGNDTTLSTDLSSFDILATRAGRTSLALWDFKVSRNDLFELPAGGLGIAAGIEVRQEKTRDDRDSTGDFSTPFVDSVTGVEYAGDTVGASAAWDIEGERKVYSAYVELAVPIVSPEMNVPMVEALDLQIAARYEDYSDVGDVAKPKIAAVWDIVEGVRLRASWQEGFRAPTLPQLAPVVRPTQTNRLDDVLCEADLRAGRINSWGECSQRPPVQRMAGGNTEMVPEDSESVSYGIVLQPTFLPSNVGDITFTMDYWELEQFNRVALPTAENALSLDYLRRVEGSTNPLVVRLDPTPADIAFVAGTGLAPVGAIHAVFSQYDNLDVRTIKGYDIGVVYSLPETSWGEFRINLNYSHTLDHFQSPSLIQQELLDAQAAGTINADANIGGAASLLQDSGNPKSKWYTSVIWNRDNWSGGLTALYIGNVFEFNVANSDGDRWEIDSTLALGLYGTYRFNTNFAEETSVTLGVRNLTDEIPPLSEGFGGYSPFLYQPFGRQVYGRIIMSF